MRNSLWLVLLMVAINLCAADKSLLNITDDLDLTALKPDDVSLGLVKKDGQDMIQVDSGIDKPWPGFSITPPEGKWDLTAYRYVAVDIENLGDKWLRVALRVDSPGKGNNNRLTGSAFIAPGKKETMKAELVRCGANAPELFGMDSFPQGMWAEKRVQPENIDKLVIFLNQPIRKHKFLVSNIRACGDYQKAPYEDMTEKEFFPFVDGLGQFIHKDWPGKTKDIADLKKQKISEEEELKKYPGPAEWDKYGGWANGPAMEAKGHFYTAKVNDKWWLVDPEGKLFFSHGITCVRPGGTTAISDRDAWFKDLPSKDGTAKEFFFQQKNVNRGHYKNKSPECFDFGKHNLFLKYGQEWEKQSAELAHKRLRSWGMNTMGLWSVEDIYSLKKTPYVTWVHYWPKPLKGKLRGWKKFHDVFDPVTWDSLKARAENFLKDAKDDPWCIGVFVDNELPWEDETALAVATLTAPADQKAKQVFINDLKEKYKSIDELNKTWGSKYASWDDMLKSVEKPKEAKAYKDLEAFTNKTIETYFKNVRDIVKGVAPNKLNLGCRFNGDFIPAAKIAAKYCDVVSYNLYRRDVSDFEVANGLDVPAIIGEWHFGASDRGLFHGGLRTVESQQARADAYKSYVSGVLKNKNFVGCHWFQYGDEMVSGRPLDAENYQIGFVDICDTPYLETVGAAREMGNNLYSIRSGKQK